MKTITIAAASIARAEAAIAEHNRRVERLNKRYGLTLALATLTVTGSHEVEVVREHGRSRKVLVAEVVVTGDKAVLAGWEFCAVISAVEEAPGYAIAKVHGASVDEVMPFVTRGGECDHCRAKRRRNTTYLVKSVAGRVDEAGNIIEAAGQIKVVGSTCVADFTGAASPAGVVAYADALSGFEVELETLKDEAEEMIAGRSPATGVARGSVANLALFIAYVRAAIRVNGWVSRGEARGTGRISTATTAWDSLDAVRMAESFMETDIPERDTVTGALAPELARARDAIKPEAGDHEAAGADLALVEELLAAKGENLDDFETNVALVVRQGFVFAKNTGVAAAICLMAKRARDKAAEEAARKLDEARRAPRRDEFFGEVGKRGDFELTVTWTKGVNSYYGPSILVTARDAQGRAAKWFQKEEIAVGTYNIRGTVKEHSVYNGKKETVLNRVDVRK